MAAITLVFHDNPTLKFPELFPPREIPELRKLLNNNEQVKAIDFAEKVLTTFENGADLYSAIAKVFENKNSLNKVGW